MNKNYNQYSDEQLWSMFIQKDKHAFQWLYEKYKKKLYGFFYNRLFQDKELAKDATQNLFLKILEKKESYNSKYPFKTWLYTIANNMCKNHYRQLGRLKNNQHIDEEIIWNENKVDTRKFERSFQEAMNTLKDEQKEIFLLRYQSHLAIKEIAVLLNTPEGTIKSSLFYSIKKMAVILKEYNHINFKTVDLWKK